MCCCRAEEPLIIGSVFGNHGQVHTCASNPPLTLQQPCLPWTVDRMHCSAPLDRKPDCLTLEGGLGTKLLKTKTWMVFKYPREVLWSCFWCCTGLCLAQKWWQYCSAPWQCPDASQEQGRTEALHSCLRMLGVCTWFLIADPCAQRSHRGTTSKAFASRG